MSSEKKIISIVDDDQDTSNLFYVILSQAFAGYDVKSFNDSASALQHFTENQSAYAMVITDLRMPGMNGLELLSKIKNANPNTRTVVISGINSDNQMFRECMSWGSSIQLLESPLEFKVFVTE